jgi:cystathionine beta-lyase
LYNFDEEISRRGDNSEKWNRYADDVLPLWVADMDFRAPKPVIDALVEKARFGIYGYQYYEEIKSTIAAWLNGNYHCGVQNEWIVIVHALVPALAQATSMRDGGVLLPVPTYMGILSAPVKTGRKPIFSPLKNTGEYYEMDFVDMRKRCADGAETMILCNPQNPVGRVYKKEELLEASRVAKENALLVISDEVHGELILEGEHIPFFTVDDYARENSITLMGPGKTCNIAGLPFGFAVIPNKKLRADFKKAAYAISESGVMHLAAASVAYSGACDDWKKELLVYLKANRDFLEAGLKKISSEIKFPRTEGSYLQWIDFGALVKGENAYQWLLERAKVAVNAGTMFYGSPAPDAHKSYVRLNFATTRARLAEALRRIEAADV